MKILIWEVFIIIVCAGVIILFNDPSITIMTIFYIYPRYVLIRLLMWLIMVLIRYYRKLRIEQKPFINKTTVTIGAPILAGLLLFLGYNFTVNLWPTAIVVDAETGKPIEGAVALAQWERSTMGSIPEGASTCLAKAKESFSDKDGKVNIGGFWGLYIFSRKPSLTVYKPGYVIWNSIWICPAYEKRTDFDEYSRTVKLLKFDKEAPSWTERYPKSQFGPRDMQDSFFYRCYSGEIGLKYQDKIKFQKIFLKHEYPLKTEENLKRYHNK